MKVFEDKSYLFDFEIPKKERKHLILKWRVI